MRIPVYLLLCLVVAFQGIAGAHAMPKRCPMDHAVGLSMTADVTLHADMDCCNDPETAARTGKLCKSDTSCTSPGACVLPSFRVSIAPDPASDPASPLISPPVSPDLSSVWRPPSAG